MVEWVGGGDPAAVGAANFASITENVTLRRDHVVFDFGCGIGRTSVKLAEFLNEGGRVVGSDIVPQQIQFCQEQFAHRFPNASFHCLNASNVLYDNLGNATASTLPVLDEEQFFQEHREAFDVVVAFSVFTHFNPAMVGRYLNLLRGVTKRSGHIVLTWFLDHPRHQAIRLSHGEHFRDLKGDLGMALFSPGAVTEFFAASAGLMVERICYGMWPEVPYSTPYLKGDHWQDVVILRRSVAD